MVYPVKEKLGQTLRLDRPQQVGRFFGGNGVHEKPRPPFKPLTEREADAQLDVPMITGLSMAAAGGAVENHAVGGSWKQDMEAADGYIEMLGQLRQVLIRRRSKIVRMLDGEEPKFQRIARRVRNKGHEGTTLPNKPSSLPDLLANHVAKDATFLPMMVLPRVSKLLLNAPRYDRKGHDMGVGMGKEGKAGSIIPGDDDTAEPAIPGKAPETLSVRA